MSERVLRLSSRLTLEPTPEELQQASDDLLSLVAEIEALREAGEGLAGAAFFGAPLEQFNVDTLNQDPTPIAMALARWREVASKGLVDTGCSQTRPLTQADM